MKELVTTMLPGGQITVPDEVRQVLGLQPHDEVVFAIDDGEVRLLAASPIDAVFGSVEPLGNGTTFDEQIQQAKDDRVAQRAAR